MKILLGTFLCLLCYFDLTAQVISQYKISASDNGRTITEMLTVYEKDTGVKFYVEYPERLTGIISNVVEETTLTRYMRQYEIDLDVYVHDDQHFLLLSADTEYGVRKGTIRLYPLRLKTSGIEGSIIELASETPLIGANLYLPVTKTGAVTDVDGKFILKTPNPLVLAEINYTGYETQKFLFLSYESAEERFVEIEMALATDFINTVTITADKTDANVSEKRTGIESLKIEAIKLLPSFLGEIDPIKGITTLPGVNSAGDIAAGFNVRGGENSQNLILQDGAIIYNPTHLFGFFSAFNPDFISNVTLMKGGGPSAFGGRVASVLDINTRNGNLNKYSMTGSVGMVSSRLSAEGPIQKNKSSFIIGGRYSYSDWFIRSFEDVQLKKSKANFYDGSLKIFQQINPKNFITASGYFSYDDFNLGIDTTYSWETKNLSIKWSHLIDDQSQYLVTLASSNYSTEVLSDDQLFGFSTVNGISALSADIRYENQRSSTTKIETGLSSTYSTIDPGERTPFNDRSNATAIKLSNQNGLELAAFIEGSFELSPKIGLSAGLRYGHFLRMGAGEVPILDYENLTGRTASLLELKSYGSGEVIADYGGLEPRISIRYLVGKNSSLKAGYHRTQQFIHQISPTTSPSPLDFWISSSPNIKPQKANQFSLGIFKNIANNDYETSVEGFYKTIENTIDYIDGVDLNLNPIFEAGLTQGKGEAYGVEVLLKKNRGDISGWIAYTWSRSLRIFDDPTPTLAVNAGKRYPSVFDQPHQLSIVLNKKLSKFVTLSTNFTYNSGRPITIPVSKYSYGPFLSVNNYSSRNEYRIPDYHRLDVSLTFKGPESEKKKYTGEFTLSIYNLYARKNAYAIYFDNQGQAFKTSILGSIFPSMAYNFKIK